MSESAPITLALKRLAPGSIEQALQKAGVYRDLNQPEEAESICLDILDVEPTHQAALRLLGLALTDRFGSRVGLFEEAVEVFEQLTNPYERTYHIGVAWERYAKAQLEKSDPHNALVGFEHALTFYEEAERIGPASIADPILRWNRCVRIMTSHPSLLEAVNREHRDWVHLSD